MFAHPCMVKSILRMKHETGAAKMGLSQINNHSHIFYFFVGLN